LQRQLKQKVFTKVIKTPDWIAWIQGPSDLIKKRGGSASNLSESRKNYFDYSKEHFTRAIICDQSKLL